MTTVGTNNSAWSVVAARGANLKVISTPRPAANVDAKYKLVPTVIYEDEDIKDEIITRKATDIVQQALTPGSVLFSFPSALFQHRTEAYDTIQKEVSNAVQFRTLSLYRQKPGGDMLIEAKFEQKEDVLKAVEKGITCSGVVYKASLVKEASTNGKLVHVQLNIVRMPNMDTFLADLMESLSFYGKVYQIKKYTCCGHFEGQVSVLIDTSVGYTNKEGALCKPEPLTRLLYLEKWDIFVPASYKGAPPVCHFCRQSGHIRKACPVLAKRQCFTCKGFGHTSRFCTTDVTKIPQNQQTTFEEDISSYETAKKQQQQRSDKQQTKVNVEHLIKPSNTQKSKKLMKKEILGEVEDSDDEMIDEVGEINAVENAPKEIFEDRNNEVSTDEEDLMVIDPKLMRTVNGSIASRYANYKDGMGMAIDSAKEMLDITAVKKSTQQKRQNISSKRTQQVPVKQSQLINSSADFDKDDKIVLARTKLSAGKAKPSTSAALRA